MEKEQRKIINKRMLVSILLAGLGALLIVFAFFGITALVGK